MTEPDPNRPLPQLAKAPASPQPTIPQTARVFVKSLAMAGITVGLIAGGTTIARNPTALGLFHSVDSVPDQEKQLRISAFAAMGPLPLSMVSPAEIPAAIKSMPLSPASQRELETRVTAPDHPAPASTPTPEANAAPTHAQPARSPAVSHQSRLAWITLWDNVVEDGDVVRIDSQGYSQIIVLGRQNQATE